jgi:hypothetical protein
LEEGDRGKAKEKETGDEEKMERKGEEEEGSWGEGEVQSRGRAGVVGWVEGGWSFQKNDSAEQEDSHGHSQ